MHIQGIRNSIKSLKRNIAKLKNRESPKAKLLLERSEKKLAKQIAILDAAGLAQAIKKKAKPKRYYKHGDYVKYIGSPAWDARKRAYYANHHAICRTCGADEKEIHLHHRTYARLFDEADADLMPLCKTCHTALHLVHKTLAMTVEEATDLWVSVTNGTPKKKKIRAALREMTVFNFKAVWRKRPKFNSLPAQSLASTLERLIGGEIGAREDMLRDRDDMVIHAARAQSTGFTRNYDRRVDAIMKKLEGA